MRMNMRWIILGLVCLSISPIAYTKDELPEVKTVKVTDKIHMLIGKGGNVGLFGGDEGSLMIDDQYAPMTERLQAAVKASGLPAPKFLLNTHYHGDHTGGNENFGKAETIIMAHDNVRKRLSEGSFIQAFNMKTPPAPLAALPIITFTESMTVHLNGETVSIQHIPPAHTDGDSLVYFKDSNVLHTGDLFFNGFYPFIDTSSGGSLAGMVAASKTMLSLINDDTKIIPGHGPLASKADLQAYHDMLAEMLSRLTKLKSEKQSLKQVLESDVLNDLHEKWGNGFLNGNKWISIIYPSLL